MGDGYSEDSSQVRADFFTHDTRIKWKYTEAVSMAGLYDIVLPHEAVALAWARHGRLLLEYMIVVLNPYHVNGYPIILTPKQRHLLLEDLAFRKGQSFVDQLLIKP